MSSLINYTDFDKITDTILFLDTYHTLDFSTRLSTKDKNGYRRFYEFQTQYQTNQFLDTNIGRSIKRSMSFYYVINNRQIFTGSIILRVNDVYILHQVLETQAMFWFFGSSRIYSEKDDRLYIKGQYTPVEYIKDLQSWLKFEPIILQNEDGSFKEGVRMYICSNEDYVDMNIDKFLEFFGYLNYQNMYLQAEAQCNYVKIAPYLSNNIIVSGGLGSGGMNNGEALAETKYYQQPPQKSFSDSKKSGTNNFLSNAKKKE
jgi:hypothetical protein